jgi:rhamnogalacturonan endolyase
MSGARRMVVLLAALGVVAGYAQAARQMENLGRGLVALRTGTNSAYIGWRMLGTDPSGISFNLYRSQNGGAQVKLNGTPLVASTNMTDGGATGTMENAYYLRPVIEGVEQPAAASFTVPANATIQQYIAIPLQGGGAVYAQMGVGDLDGDGEYEYLVKWSTAAGTDPGSTHTASAATMFIDAYKLNGTFMWRINLGWNLELGDDYTPMLVYDIDGDGKAEVMTKTAEGTTDGTGVTTGDTNGDGITDYRDAGGRVLSGPEFLSIYRGTDGRELARTNWPARGNVSDWGDSYGNRVSRHLMGIAYVDGVRPSIVVCHGVYALQKVDVWNYRHGSLTRLWSWTNGGTGPAANQCLRMGDVDGDGKDEIIKGCFVLDDDGSILYDTGLGHGDFLVLSVIDPNRAGLQIFAIHEAGGANAAEVHDAGTGAIIWGKSVTGDPSRGPAAHIDPRYKGLQCWSGGSNNLYNYDGSVITASGPSAGYYWTTIFWNEDLRAEIISDHSNGYNIVTWDYLNSKAVGVLATGSGRVRIGIVADVLGDWREELVCVYPNEVRVFTTTTMATSRYYTFMHDPIYRLNSGQWGMRNAATAQPGFYFGTNMSAPPRPDIWTCAGRSQADLDGSCQVDFLDSAIIGSVWAGDTTAWGQLAQFVAEWLACYRNPSSECWR